MLERNVSLRGFGPGMSHNSFIDNEIGWLGALDFGPQLSRLVAKCRLRSCKTACKFRLNTFCSDLVVLVYKFQLLGFIILLCLIVYKFELYGRQTS